MDHQSRLNSEKSSFFLLLSLGEFASYSWKKSTGFSDSVSTLGVVGIPRLASNRLRSCLIFCPIIIGLFVVFFVFRLALAIHLHLILSVDESIQFFVNTEVRNFLIEIQVNAIPISVLISRSPPPWFFVVASSCSFPLLGSNRVHILQVESIHIHERVEQKHSAASERIDFKAFSEEECHRENDKENGEKQEKLVFSTACRQF